MKVFFALLLLTNILFALIQWLLPYEQVIKSSSLPLNSEKLRLLEEIEVAPARQPPPIDASITQPSFELPSTVPDRLCYTLGPFKDQQIAQEVALNFKQNRIAISSRSSLEKEYMGMMVYLDGMETREDAARVADSLALKGVKDYIIVSEPERQNVLSLGVFSLKKNAEGRFNRIRRLGYDVKSEARYRNRTIYWLDYSESENENLTRFIDTLKVEKGISRISRQCS
ncbi:MAG: hypothetical protein H8E21_14435 [Gammaproteobacteria bacterium]|nr:hypothetical protein [Gammaproteobacteria bacterium]MBL7000382.1 hypothetical protein [Gammaproteobacteria bacterium]